MEEEQKKDKDLEVNSFIPLYQQLYDNIRKQISAGIYKPGDKIPSEGDLGKEFNVSRITVRNALKQLVEEEILCKKRGKGTYVTIPARVEALCAGNSFTNSCHSLNAKPSTKIISTSIEKAKKAVCAALNIEQDEKVICIKRLRLIDDMPAIFEIDYFRMDYTFLLKEDLEDASLMETISRNITTQPKRVEDVFEVKYSKKEYSDYLKCPVNMPLLKVRQIVCTENDEVLYYNVQYIRSDKYKYAVSANI
ncbi:MAG: GntR family transcriptional regulator [Terrisporobacter sp.]|uniref:GntR family transcriptional regulator n=1 Tax=Terrisporobacter sp. TaxID=1965305 RepID=UPI002FC9912D